MTRKQNEEVLNDGTPPGAATSLEFSFSARAPSAEQWRGLTHSVGFRLLPVPPIEGRVDLWHAEFVALPEVIKQDSRFLSGEVHPKFDEPEVAHWVLRLKRVPSPTPPQVLVEASQGIGGYPGIIARMLSAWPAELRLKMSLKCTFVLDEKLWSSPFAPARRMALKPIASSGQKAVLSFEAYTWKLESGEVLSEVVDLGYVDRAKGLFGLSVSGQGTVEFGAGMFSQAEALLWHGIAAFLKKPSRRGRARPKA
jgi:hypothetical protein